MNTIEPAAAVTLLAEKLDAIESLLRMARKQRAVVDAGDWTALHAVLDSKRTIVDRIESLDRALEPWLRAPAESRRYDSPAQRDACRNAVLRCQALLEETLALEGECERRVAAERSAVEAALREADAVDAAGSSYAVADEVADARGAGLDLASED